MSGNPNLMDIDEDDVSENFTYTSNLVPPVPQLNPPLPAAPTTILLPTSSVSSGPPLPLIHPPPISNVSSASTVPIYGSHLPTPFQRNLHQNTQYAGVVHTQSMVLNNDEPLTLKPISEPVGLSEDPIKISLKPLYNKLHLSAPVQVPCIISLLGCEAELDLIEQNRQGIDLVFVVDISGSMGGGKIDLVKVTIEFVITIMKEFDRVSIIGFSDSAYIYCPLTVMNESGKAKVTSIAQSLGPTGGTNIQSGVCAALHVLADRSIVNQLSSILLLSDGCDNDTRTVNARVQEQFRIYKPKIKEQFRMHTFGYGRDHDSRVMNLMAEENNGNFYYIEREETVAEAFSFCLGELVALVASEVQVTLTTLPCEVQFKLSKVYSTTGDTVFPMPNLFFNDKKDSVFVLDFEACQHPPNATIRPVQAVVTYTLKGGKKLRKEEFLSIDLVGPAEEIIKSQEVMLEFYRVKGAEALKQVAQLADMNDLNNAKKLAREAAEEVKHSEVAANLRMQALYNDLVDCQQRLESRHTWESGGRAQVTSVQNNHFNKVASVNCPIYSSSVQAAYSMKSNNYVQSSPNYPSYNSVPMPQIYPGPNFLPQTAPFPPFPQQPFMFSPPHPQQDMPNLPLPQQAMFNVPPPFAGFNPNSNQPGPGLQSAPQLRPRPPAPQMNPPPNPK